MTDAVNLSPQDEKQIVDEFHDLYDTYYRQEVGELAEKYPDKTTLVIDWKDTLWRQDPDLADDFLSHPSTFRPLAEEALRNYPLPIDVKLEQATVALTNVDEQSTFEVGEYRKEQINNLVQVKGQVAQTTSVNPRLQEAHFECQRCGTPTIIPQQPGEFQEPHECNGCERQGPFTLRVEQSELEDYQLIRLKLPPEKRSEDRQIDISLQGDLVSSASAGDRVRVNVDLDARLEDTDDSVLVYTGEATNLEVEKTDFEEIEIGADELKQIREIADGDPYEAIVQSMAPGVHGYEEVKLALGLQLFGGTKKQLKDGTEERGDWHCFLVGDPGTAKSTFLDFGDKMAPRSVYTDGTGSSAAGLTASAVRDDFGGESWTIKAGSIVKAHKGMCFIDELDDMDEDDRKSMNTAMAKQEVPVSKAGISTSLPAETSILAAANPKYGRFDSYEPIPDQINIDPALLSRFDLIFTMTDDVVPDEDREIIRHKLKNAQAAQVDEANVDVDIEHDPGEPEIGPELFQKYVAHAKQEITPVYTDESWQYVESEFMDLRQANKDADIDPEDEPVPVTFRKLEAVTRLAESSARARLSPAIEMEDVERAMRLIRKSLSDVGIEADESSGDSPTYDADMVETGTSKTQQNRMTFVTKMMAELDERGKGGVTLDELCDVASGDEYKRDQLEYAIEKLKKQGEIYENERDDEGRKQYKKS